MVLIISLIGAVFLLGLIIVRFPKWQVSYLRRSGRGTPVHEVFKAENEARRTLIQLLGGLFFFAGLIFTWLQLQATQDRQITDRFSKAIEHLGDETLAVRLGGIYALERIARDSERDHWTTMEVLTAYVRENSPRAQRVNGQIESDTLAPSGVKPDIQTILTVIGRRNTAHEQGQEYVLYLRGAHLRKAILMGADLSGAVLFRADLSGALLFRADLSGAVLNRADLSGADLGAADLSGAILSGADLSGADLSEADLSEADFSGVNLIRADLSGADLSGALGLTKEQLQYAITNEQTILPVNLRN